MAPQNSFKTRRDAGFSYMPFVCLCFSVFFCGLRPALFSRGPGTDVDHDLSDCSE